MGNHKKTVRFRSELRQATIRRLEPQRSIPSWRLDVDNECLRRGEQAVALTPKAFAVLRYLVEHPDRLVTKAELFDAIWPDTHVSDGVLKNCVMELRKALADEARAPQVIETVYRRGYRLIAPLTTASPVSSSKFHVSSSDTQHSVLVGRETEIVQLHGWLEKALRGERQIVFVTGEPGIGKTTLAEAFLQQIAPDGQLWIGRGQCIEHYGAGEAYLPILEALGRLCRASGGKPFIDLLARHAPTWLVQMPALVRAAELETLQRKVAGATKERMLRELAEAIEALTAERPLVLWLEDLHWGNYSTLDWLAVVARRQERARLLIIGTYRPVEVLAREHPLKAVKQELQTHGYCIELPARLSE
jgi:DNA-binding winged helix-turn-helix (wHTH) protein/chloramphenicol 3-O-phosphotransferase